jgi:hypothetical protein
LLAAGSLAAMPRIRVKLRPVTLAWLITLGVTVLAAVLSWLLFGLAVELMSHKPVRLP